MKERGFFNTVDMTVADEVSINSDTMICSKFCRTEKKELYVVCNFMCFWFEPI